MVESASTTAVFASGRETLEGLTRLQKSGVRLDGISVIGRDSYREQTSTGNYAARGCIEYSEYLGPFWSSIASVLKDLVLLYAPGLGLIRVAGELAKQTIRALKEDAESGSQTLMEAQLSQRGIPLDRIIRHEFVMREGGFLLIAAGTMNEIHRVRDLLSESQGAEIGTFSATSRQVEAIAGSLQLHALPGSHSE